MGVHGLWELLAPVGRRVSVETLTGKRLAIDASIWMIQFMKAMRDEKGEMVRNAHILGFFRRICKLLYLRTKPVFVFDGGTPALKRRTVIARRRQRENDQVKIRKTAEKLLLNHLKQMRLQELAADLEKQRQENDVKGKKPIEELPSKEKETEKGKSDETFIHNQEELDQLLAASLAAEENEGFTNDGSTSGARVKDDDVFGDDEEDDDENEEMIIPEMHGKVDPAVLAALPPSMQLDLLVQMRERLMAENRQKYQKVKKAPSRFSELQIESYLKTVAFRREIDGAQKAARGIGISGVQTSRIASEANREYIFSSSFTGDKQALAFVGQESSDADQSRAPPASCSTSAVDEVLSSRRSGGGAAGPSESETGKKAFHEDVETYRDERGRLRVSRVRALGIHMTRDLQRNLDLMKEIDRERGDTSREKNNSQFISAKNHVLDKINDGTCIEISFEDTLDNENRDDDDNIFARLVAGDQLDNTASVERSLNSDSDNEWQDGAIKNITPLEDGSSDEGEVEWEEGFRDIEMKSSSCPREIFTKGAMEEEEANIREAIKRSLEKTMGFTKDFHADNVIISEKDREMVTEGEANVYEAGLSKKTMTNGASEEEEANIQEATMVHESMNDFHEYHTISKKEERPENEASEANVSQQKSINAPESNSDELKKSAEFYQLFPGVSDGDLACETLFDARRNFQAELVDQSCGTAEHVENSGIDSITDAGGTTNELVGENNFADFSMENDEVDANSSFVNDGKDREMTDDRLEEEMMFLSKEREELGSEQRKLERNSESVSSEMFAECQELLQMFGLPYIIAPMEAEAQCAFMELADLVDGVVTDDSDAFLFGGRSVYKNIFDDRKYVETYFMKDIENELGLDREKLIHMALLLGSDYTEGISGIGIVNAIEVVNAFPGKDGLREFRDWVESPDPSILGKLHVNSGNPRKKVSKVGENVTSSDDVEVFSSDQLDDVERVKRVFMEKHRNISKNWHVSSFFPSDAVISAYAVPQVDKSREPLSWGKPDMFVLRKLCWEKFGWGTSKADELLLPVLKEYNKHETQLRLEAFYTFNERFAKIRSKRINKAVKEITKHKSSSDLADEMGPPKPPTGGRKRKAKPCGDDVGPTSDAVEKPTLKKSKRGQTEVTGSGKRGGRGRGGTTGRGRRKNNSSREDAEIETGESDEETQLDEAEDSGRVRRSGRLRKTVNYNVADEVDDSDKDIDENRLEQSSVAEDKVGRFKEIGGRNFVEDNEETSKTNNPGVDLVVDDDKMDGHFKGSDFSEDYIQYGGGFCVDEDEDMEPDKQTTETNRERSEGNNSPLVRPRSPGEKRCSDYRNEVNTNDETRVENEDVYSRSLRSMPNLRRKKRTD